MINLYNLYELEEVMNGLEHTDCFFTAIVINNSIIKTFLENHDIIDTKNSGASCRGKNYELFNSILIDLLYEIIEEYGDD